MALSGSFSGNILSGAYKLRVDWSAAQNVANNTSKITANMYLEIKSGWDLDVNARSDNTTYIGGTTYKWSSPAIDKAGASTTKLATVTSGDIAHNANGTKSVTITATYYIRFTRNSTGVFYEKITASQTITLNTIPRATQPSLSASSVYMGDAVTIDLPRASSSFTHDLAYSLAGGSYVSIATGQGASYKWTVPDLTSKVPNATSGSMTIRCITKNGSTTIGTKTVSMTAKVPRATQPSLSVSSADMGAAVKISLPKAGSNFKHDLAYSFAGGSYVSIATGQGTSYDWAVPDLASQIPKTTSGTLTVRCITKNGTATVGTKTVSMTAKVPTTADYMPSISAVTVAEQTSGLAAQFGAYIQNKSNIKTTISAAGAKGSTISSYSTTFAGKTYTGSSWTSGVITKSGSLNLVTTVKDSRGRTATKTMTISVLAYTKPTISAFAPRRTTQAGVEDSTNGTYVGLAYKYAVTSLNAKNTASFKVQIKGINESEWTTILTKTDYSANVTQLTVPSDYQISTDNSYDLRATLSDWFGSGTPFLAGIQSGAVILDLLADGKGISFGKSAEHSGFAEFGLKIMANNGEIPAGAVELKTNDNLNDYTTPGFYIFSASVNSTLSNRPFGGSGSGSLQVIPEGEVTQVRQVLTRCSSEAREIWERLYYSNAWHDWACVYKGGLTGRVLWSGSYHMDDKQTINLADDKAISKQPNGLVLVFSFYENSAAADHNFQHHFVSKHFVANQSNKSSIFTLYRYNFAAIGSKALYFKDTTITGNANNVASGTANGISYNNNSWVLRYVIGV